MPFKRAVMLVLDLLFPPRCVFCNQIIPPGRTVCETCCNDIVPLNSIIRINAGHLGKNIPCAVLYTYTDKVRESIIRFKFQGERQSSVFYANELSHQIKKLYGKTFIDAVTCVPISKQRRKSRGYNQSELVARGISRNLTLPYADCLIKVKDNTEQHFLGKEERRRNVKDAYSLAGFDVSGKNILLIDDIVTTGSTISECAKVLLAGGAKVSCAAIALAKL